MTVTEQSSRKVIPGAGWVNPLTHPYVIESAAHVHVFADGVELVQGVDYTVTNVLNPAGYAVTITNPGSWAPTNWVLDARPPIDQAKDLTVGGTFGAKFEDGLDKLDRRLQRVWDLARRGLKTGLSVAVGDNPYTLPAPAASKLLGWNPAGTDMENVDPIGIGIAMVDDDATMAANSALRVATQRATKAYANSLIDDDATLAGNSPTRAASQRATKTFVNALIDDDAALTGNSPTRVASQRATKAYADTKQSLNSYLTGLASGFVQAGTGAITRIWRDKAREILSVEDFGAKGDVVLLSNGVTTSGSTAFSCASATFTAADVGKKIAIKAGGAAGIPLLTTIAGFVDATHVTLGTNAGNSVSGEFYYGTDDTAAVNLALSFAGSAGVPLTILKRYLVTNLVAAGALALVGCGENVSQFVMHGVSANFSYDAGSSIAVPLNTPSFKFSDIAFVTGYEKNTAANGVVYANFPDGGYPLETVRGYNALVSTLGVGFGLAWNLNNADAFTLYNVGSINGNVVASHPVTGSTSIKVQGNLKPLDVYMFGCRHYFSEVGVDVVGQALFANVIEAVNIIDCLIIVCDTCIRVNSASPMPYLHVEGCNLNGYVADIVVNNVIQLHVVNNLIYSVGDRSGLTNWTGIQVNSDSGIGFNAQNLIANNIFNANNSPSTTTIGATWNAIGVNQGTLVSSNSFDGCDIGVQLFSGANNVIITPTNVFTNCTTNVLDQSTTDTNTYMSCPPLGLGGQVVLAEQFSLSAADISGANSTGVQNWFAAAQDTFKLKAGTTYDFEAKLLLYNTGTNSRSVGLLFGGTATFTDFHYNALASNSNNWSAPSAPTMTETSVVTNTLVTAAVAAITQNSITVRGTMRVNAAGTFIPQFAYSAVPGAAPLIVAGTFFRIWPKGSASVPAVGAA